MAAKISALLVWASLALSAAPARAVSLWEFAMTERPETAREVIEVADAVFEQLQGSHGRLPSGVERQLLERLAQEFARALALNPRNAMALGGLARVEERLGRSGRVHYERSRAYAERSLEVAPTGPDATAALFTLSLACTRLERFEEARDAYLRALEFTLEDDARAIVYGNLADTYVSLDDLPHAIDAYRAALSAQPSAMGWLGLAVTLDRAGRDDYAQAADQALLAAVHAHHAQRAAHGFAQDPDDPLSLSREIENPNVFFVPGYDRHYYDAVATEAIARFLDPTDASMAAVQRVVAATAWEYYLQLAPPTDRWRARAERHLRALRAPAPARPTARTPVRRAPVEVE